VPPVYIFGARLSEVPECLSSMGSRTKKSNDEEQSQKWYVLLDPAKCKPNMPAFDYFRRNAGACGKECITASKNPPLIVVYKNACAGCLNRAKRCPDNAAKVIKLPSNLSADCVHTYGENSFKLHGLPMPRAGEVLGMLGCNGTGKSTALKILAGILKPNLGGLDTLPTWADIVKHYRGSDLQNYFKMVLEEKLTVSLKPQIDQDIAKSLSGQKVGKLLTQKDQRDCLDYLTKALDLGHLLDRDVKELSGGELQRLAIALCMMKDADVYMFDEPTSYLDVRQRIEATRVIRSLVNDGKKRHIIVVEHDLAILDYISDFIHCLYGESGAYGVVAKRAGCRNGINNYLSGYLPAENMQFRDVSLDFKVSQISAADAKELGLGIGVKAMGTVEYPAMTKVLQSEEGNKSFTLHVKPGNFNGAEVIGLMGENGTGKTTYLQMLAGLYDKETTAKGAEEKTFDCAQISLLGMGITMAYKRQDYAPKFRRYTKSVRELLERNTQIAFTDSMFGLLVMKPLNMQDLMDLPVASLSGGELQRLACVVCLGTPASVYLIDEPSAGLDCEQRIIMAKVIKRWIISHLQRTCFVIEHDCLMMSALADRIILFTGQPGVETYAESPSSVGGAFNEFLKSLDVTFRRDPTNHRPRINKENSVKDREQKRAGEYYLLEIDENDAKDKD
jgi:ATP-binding cassette subfamily E protein 1